MKQLGLLSLALVTALAPLPGCKKEEARKDPAPAAAKPTPPAPEAGSAAPAAAAPTPPAPPAPAEGSAAPTAAGEGLKFPDEVVAVGDKRTKTEDMTMKLAVQGTTVDVSKHAKEIREVLAVENNVITRAKLTYVESEQRQASGDKRRETTSPLVGKSYIVARVGDALEVTREDGSPVPEPERAELLDENKRLGKANPMERVISTKTFQRGVPVVFTPAELAAVGDADSDQSLEALTLTLTGVDAGVATLAMKMALARKDARGAMTMTLEGTMRVDVARGRLLEAIGAGPVTANMGAPVTGTMQMKTVHTY